MTTLLHVDNGHPHGGTTRERWLMRLLWTASWPAACVQLRGFWRITRLAQKLFGITDRQWVRLPNQLQLSIDLADPYWNRLISPRFVYEPEIHHVLARLSDQPYVFIDCGANMGYWSCHVAGGIYGNHPTIAIEALTSNAALLRANLDANQLDQVHVYHRAISDQLDQTVTLYQPGGHASVSLFSDQADNDQTKTESVQTITLDALQDDPHLQNNHPIVIKLDVESAEIIALKGGANLLERNPIILYEDHGQDDSHAISAYILNELGYHIAFMSDDGRYFPMPTLDAIAERKTDPTIGYNFIAHHPDCALAQALSSLAE